MFVEPEGPPKETPKQPTSTIKVSKKTRMARELGVRIITEAELWAMLGIGEGEGYAS